ncbi:MAG TPA: outer membrane lipoprotein chaperone LolA [Accumulibacter sp.]|uniref:outer membrane lipoprotein chaperone LolA n=1 Tax=Accumulibacter sp. TaxID=2053492 RepID=UPI00287B115B|nr:outer membrane lipoprotein chaperone LolA [Accumulibacter sp.]MDS4055885.1 outer membrane lipoprotein chaperone LolA [Accumulibacter sp.]HMV04113.1 outer membrane lipoprotein chaperone LolA [Accumulibacter sp.]HMW62513.1 outer membrane lipoprotein chaperone LolA [Accumulibacter sp.]HMW81827.1 outer membrane lipoprotein chaperone LolA [Accumulibacter sp.]HMX69440.1 outer membrane lipoprotein chaperone LolA [Accumulibacter sp.]
MSRKPPCLAGVLLAALLSGPHTAHAGTIDDLHRFLSGTRTLRADFAQTVVARNGRNVQTASGVMMIARPGKFRWQIEQPYSQLLVGDGEKVWMHDPELRQVTVRKVGAALGGSPAALLAGDNTIEKNFNLREEDKLGETRSREASDGIAWLEARPKTAESGFEKIRLGFAAHELKMMELHDSLGQTTKLSFSRIERNPRLPPTLFRFVPPADADLVGE